MHPFSLFGTSREKKTHPVYRGYLFCSGGGGAGGFFSHSLS